MSAYQFVAPTPAKPGDKGVRHLFIDTETTGLNPDKDRIISLGMVEVIDGRITQSFEWFFNPENVVMAPEVIQIHGITPEFLADKPPIKTHLAHLLGMLHSAIWGGQNIKFDIDMLNAELRRHRFPALDQFLVGHIDTMKMSRERWPGQRASLDDICRRLSISTAHREKHGALLDATLTAQAYLAMTREQLSLLPPQEDSFSQTGTKLMPIAQVLVVAASAEEEAEHAAYLATMEKETGTRVLWSPDEEDSINDNLCIRSVS